MKCGGFIMGTGGVLWVEAPPCGPLRASAGGVRSILPRIMEPESQGMPNDVLIVEDDAIIALDFEDTLLGFGVKSVRACGSAARALKLIEERAPDFALLDVGLAGGNSFGVAEKLQALNIPFAFVTGYGRRVGLPPALSGTPTLPKPCTSDMLEAALRAPRG